MKMSTIKAGFFCLSATLAATGSYLLQDNTTGTEYSPTVNQIAEVEQSLTERIVKQESFSRDYISSVADSLTDVKNNLPSYHPFGPKIDNLVRDLSLSPHACYGSEEIGELTLSTLEHVKELHQEGEQVIENKENSKTVSGYILITAGTLLLGYIFLRKEDNQ